MYIAIEGTKGTGKSTLLEALTVKLQDNGIDFQCFTPTKPMPKDTWWEKAYSDYSQDDTYLESLYAARANYHASNTNFNCGLVLGDRSILTSCVTRWPHHDISRLGSYLKQIQKKQFLVPSPDLVLYLDLPLEVTLVRLAQRERDYGLLDEKAERLQQVKKAYSSLLQYKDELGFTNMQYQLLDANQKIEDLLENTYDLIVKKLEKNELFQ
jgi:thymidylate kinase